MLTIRATSGFRFNPVTFYYRFDPTGERLEAVLAEVTNTPGEAATHLVEIAPRRPDVLPLTSPSASTFAPDGHGSSLRPLVFGQPGAHRPLSTVASSRGG